MVPWWGCRGLSRWFYKLIARPKDGLFRYQVKRIHFTMQGFGFLSAIFVRQNWKPVTITDGEVLPSFNLARFDLNKMCSERDSPLEPFVLPDPGQPELTRLTCGAHLAPPVLTWKQKRPRVNSLVCDRAAAFCVAGPPEVLSRMSRPVMQAAEREWELMRARSQQLKQAAPRGGYSLCEGDG